MPAEKKTGKKARWSASKKAAAKKKPRPARRTDRDEYRPARDERPERQDRRGRDERPARDDRPSHGSRGDRDRDREQSTEVWRACRSGLSRLLRGVGSSVL